MEYPPLIPYLVVSDAAGAIEFYKHAFGAVELARHHAGDSTQISHAHLLINGGSVMWMPSGSAHWRVERRWRWSWRINSGVTATVRWSIRMGTSGRWDSQRPR